MCTECVCQTEQDVLIKSIRVLEECPLSSMDNKWFRESICLCYDILLFKLKFYGVSGKDLQLYQSYLGNKYCRTAIYNDSKNSHKVSNWAEVRHGVPQGSIFGPLLFLLYINDLPKIINKISTPIIFADNTSILFAHSNLLRNWS